MSYHSQLRWHCGKGCTVHHISRCRWWCMMGSCIASYTSWQSDFNFWEGTPRLRCTFHLWSVICSCITWTRCTSCIWHEQDQWRQAKKTERHSDSSKQSLCRVLWKASEDDNRNWQGKASSADIKGVWVWCSWDACEVLPSLPIWK